MRCWVIPVLVVAGLLTPGLARAQQATAETAEVLFARAEEHAKKGAYRAACPLFAESLRVDPQVGTLLNLADCEEHIGALTQALVHWREGIDRLSGPDGAPKFLAYARRRADALDPRVPRLTIRLAPSAPPGTRVQRGEEELASAALGVAMMVNPGSIEVVARAPGRVNKRETVTLSEGEQREVVIEPGPEAPQAAPPPPIRALAPLAPVAPVARSAPAVPDMSFGQRHRASLITAGVGGAIAIAGIAVGAAARADFVEIARTCAGSCTPDLGKLHAEVAATNVLLGVAGALGVASVVTFAVEARAKRPSVAVGASAAGVRVVVRF